MEKDPFEVSTHMWSPELMAKRSEIQTKLKECRDEWLESKPGKGQQKYLGVNTIRQILDNAAVYWEFDIIDQWREEVYRYNKDSAQWQFDGYVYHTKGKLVIPLLGSRVQFGSKVAIGGKDNQDSAYKAAASNCLNKCASLFGVGESIYSKIQVQQDEYMQLQQDPNYATGQQYGQQYYPPQGQPYPQY